MLNKHTRIVRVSVKRHSSSSTALQVRADLCWREDKHIGMFWKLSQGPYTLIALNCPMIFYFISVYNTDI